MAASYICNWISHSALNTETPYKKLYGKDADLSHLKIIGARAFVHIKTQASWATRRGKGRCTASVRPRATPTTKSASRGQAALAATRSRVAVVRFQRRHARRQLRLARRHAAGRAELHLRSGFRCWHACRNGITASASTSLTRRHFAWGSLACGISSGGVTPEGSSPPPAPISAAAAPRATNGCANRGSVGVTPAVTRSRAASRLPVPVATRYGGGPTTTEQLWRSFFRRTHYSV